jgi:hypothetical protein
MVAEREEITDDTDALSKQKGPTFSGQKERHFVPLDGPVCHAAVLQRFCEACEAVYAISGCGLDQAA